ncbi:PREDICTED: uncharacterized protein LOC109584297 [Amphimedon queenslandica]|uniref:Uncharacterized protein n=2 Tax=Amphimedon queenslandica TaxID=400682 RepID=A0AAN0JET6_AMPQE|nr:PREDICTED: uncharacterized protein LOC109584297 [Amphimedon queenslandica]|eukprot:XP_019855540.1 PREDICTED: uncharacterized protein LOC109584297 [Amphimedon queenslandica]
MCKAQRYLSSKAENYEKENKKLKFDKRRWEELEINLNNTFDEASERFQFELQQKDRRIIHLTRRNAKLESAETAWKVNLDFEKDKVRRLKRDGEERISNLERIKDAEIASLRERLNDTETKLEDEMKSRLVVEELNHQLRSQLEEVPIFKKDLSLLPVFPRSPWTSSIYYNGIEDSLNNNTSELSNGYGLNIDDVPPPFAGVEYMYMDIEIVAENNKYQDSQKQWIVASDFINKTDPCLLSSDSADPLEKIPSSLHSIWIGARHVT